ncbi:MAG: hypothetical protein AAGA69_06890 [Pseudomonadota bacterium]
MLLRRITEHVKAQNWTAVALDFVIVVVGVFMGIQVANWNDARATNVRSAQLLDRLEEEFRLFEVALTQSYEDLVLFESSSINLLDTIRQDAIDTTDPEQITYWLGFTRQMSRPQARSAVLLEMVSSGELSLLPEDIRLAVTQFDQQIQRNEYLWPEAVGYLTSSEPLFQAVDYAYIGHEDRVLDFDAEKLPLAETNLETIMLYQGALK